MRIEAGTRLGPYEIVSRLGAGGMGEVWRARDTRLDRSVAVKILPADFADDAHLRIRFEREAKTISQLEHPHICRLYDVGPGYLVMELLEGESLADRIARGPLPLHDVLRYGAQIADALDGAHRAGVVHRDLKPGNIMITRGGAKLLDFGLAKSQAVVEVEGATVQKPLTQEGTILGTFQYMAPEQLEGEEADARTDIFALGAVLYEMATGRRAFEAKTRTSLIAAIVKEQPPPLSNVAPLAPAALEHVIRRCLAKDRLDRWQSARDVAEELRWIAEGGSEAGAARAIASRSKRARTAWVVAAIALAALAAAAAVYVQSRRPPPVYGFTISRSDGPYTLAGPAMISPDGTRFCFTARDANDTIRLFVRSVSSFDVRALEGTENASQPVWSTDGRSILFFADTKMKVVDPDRGAPRVVTEAKDIFGMAMNRHGEIIFGTGGGLRRLRRDGSIENLTTVDARRHEVVHAHPTFLPDENRVLFLTILRDAAKGTRTLHLRALSLDSREVRAIGEFSSRVVYTEPGYLLFVRGGTLMATPFDPRSMQLKGDARAVAEGVYFFAPTGVASFSASLDGILTYRAPFGGESLAWVDRDGRRTGTVGPVGDFYGARIARDGASVAAAVLDLKIGTSDLWSFGTRRETAARLTADPGFESSPIVTPDGGTLIYSSDRGGPPDIYVKRIGSAEEDRLLVAEPGEQYGDDLSPDGRHLVFESNDYSGRQADLMVIALDGDAKPVPFVRTPFNEYGARFSPDGKWIAYHSNESGGVQVYVKPYAGPGPSRQVSTSGGSQPRWSPDGRRLYFRNGKRVYEADMTVAEPQPKLLFESELRFETYEVAPDDQRFLLNVYDERATNTPTRVIVNWTGLLRD